MKRFCLLIAVLFLSACESKPINTSQLFNVDLIGVDEAYCILSTKYNSYIVHAPGQTRVQRSSEDLKIDCRVGLDRRRVMMLKPLPYKFFYRYPENITVDFTIVETGSRYNGFRIKSAPQQGVHETVLTEDSFSKPIETAQNYPVERDVHLAGRRSMPVSLMP